ncbi:MAG TPA: FtsW/RodA/SpoVE family cell cycle protein [Anaerolineaceae bacterium]|nr:FtsW/RodA/SpoVE family cell cycle protein [Anaerolineaceae bacterium]
MKLPPITQDRNAIEKRLMLFAAGFVILYAVILSLSPAVRLYSWKVPYRWEHWLGVLVWFVGFYILSHQLRRSIPARDPILLPIFALLTGWGLMTIWRLSVSMGLRQTIWLTVSMVILFAGLKFPGFLEILRRYKYVWLVSMLLLAGLTLAFGTYPGGSGPRLWLGCCGVYFQPSELLKLFLIIYLAAFFGDLKSSRLTLLQQVVPTLLLVGSAILLLAVQRDFGTATIFLILFTALVYLATGRREVLIISAFLILAASILGYFSMDVIRLRLTTWLNPQIDPGNQSYQIMQSLMAVAAGGLIGSGPGLGSPGVVPVAVSDFIFSAIVEETGLLGGLCLLLLFGFLLFRGLRISLSAPNTYLRLLAAGISSLIFAQALLIIGGNIDLLPLTGVTLPFISYGGSSLVSASLAFLLLLQSSGLMKEEPDSLVQTRQYQGIGGIALAGIAAAAILLSWWAVAQSESLATRNDNPRRSIADRYIPRGSLLDRKNQPIARTVGQPGEYSRSITYPLLGTTIGYSHPMFTQGGLEASLDPYLRGLRGNPSSWIWSTQLVYSHPPQGLDVRLSLDLDLQTIADQALGDATGTLLLLNSESGEILALASHPSFDPNQMDENWETYRNDPNAPLVNRATQGLYPLGSLMGPFLLADSMNTISLSSSPQTLIYSTPNRTLDCSSVVVEDVNWGTAIAAGCPGAAAQLAQTAGKEGMINLIKRLGFSEAPQFDLLTAIPEIPGTDDTPTTFLEQPESLKVSPLQVALAAASLQNQGNRPAPRLAIAVNTGSQGWVALPVGSTFQVYSASPTRVIRALQMGSMPAWEVVSTTTGANEPVSWWIGGALPEWTGVPFTIVVAIEEENAAKVQRIGQDFLEALIRN